jgi:hypothetical protein
VAVLPAVICAGGGFPFKTLCAQRTAVAKAPGAQRSDHRGNVEGGGGAGESSRFNPFNNEKLSFAAHEFSKTVQTN